MAVGLDRVFGDAELSGELGCALYLRLLGDFDVG
jgi:hypothetical protein